MVVGSARQAVVATVTFCKVHFASVPDNNKVVTWVHCVQHLAVYVTRFEQESCQDTVVLQQLPPCSVT